MNDSSIQVHGGDDVPAFLFAHETLVPGASSSSAFQDPVFALVALLVALVHHRGSCSVTLGNRRAILQSPRQMRGLLRWRTTERDWV